MLSIKEFLPNPAGSDTAGEYVTVINKGTEAVSLSGWSLKDAGGSTYKFSIQTLKAGEELKLPHAVTKISLNNNGETITLFDPQGMVADTLAYSGAAADGELINHERAAAATQLFKRQESVEPHTLVTSGATPQLVAFGLSVAVLFALLAVFVVHQIKDETVV